MTTKSARVIRQSCGFRNEDKLSVYQPSTATTKGPRDFNYCGRWAAIETGVM